MEKPIDKMIFILALKQSVKYRNTTYCIGVFKLGTPHMEFIYGETGNDREYTIGEEISYINHADYTNNMHDAIDWLNSVE